MSDNQKKRLLVAAKDLVQALSKDEMKGDELLTSLSALRYEVRSTFRFPIKQLLLQTPKSHGMGGVPVGALTN